MGINYDMKLFSAIAIVLIVAGHVSSVGFAGPFDMFRPYSFHVASFVFISGYFYSSANEKHPVCYITRKIRRLIVPLYLISLVYGILCALLRAHDFSLGQNLSLESLLIMPLTSGHQFSFTAPMWFIAPLFTAEVLNILIRLSLSKVSEGRGKELALFILFLALGAFAISWGREGYPLSGWDLFACRGLFFLSCFGMGRFYKTILEEYDTLPNVPYFLILLSTQLLLFILCNDSISYTAAWCKFPKGAILTYLVTITGIAFWLRICKILATYRQLALCPATGRQHIQHHVSPSRRIFPTQYPVCYCFALNALLLRL